jgi:hypothetical protein
MREVGMVVLDRQDSGNGGVADDGLRDVELQAEIELVADLVLAASGSETPLTAADIDRVLGVVPPGSADAVPAVPGQPAATPAS